MNKCSALRPQHLPQQVKDTVHGFAVVPEDAAPGVIDKPSDMFFDHFFNASLPILVIRDAFSSGSATRGTRKDDNRRVAVDDILPASYGIGRFSL